MIFGAVRCATAFPREHCGTPAALGHLRKLFSSAWSVSCERLFGGRTFFACMGLLHRPKRFFQEPKRVSSMLVAMLMFSFFRCSCSILEDVLWIVPALPSLGFCYDPRCFRKAPENHFRFKVPDAISWGDVLRIWFASPAWGFAPILDVLLENGFPFDKEAFIG